MEKKINVIQQVSKNIKALLNLNVLDVGKLIDYFTGKGFKENFKGFGGEKVPETKPRRQRYEMAEEIVERRGFLLMKPQKVNVAEWKQKTSSAVKPVAKLLYYFDVSKSLKEKRRAKVAAKLGIPVKALGRKIRKKSVHQLELKFK